MIAIETPMPGSLHPAGSARLDEHLTELHNLGNDLEEWCEVRVRKDLIPKGATLVEAYLTEKEIVVMGQPKSDDESHNCDAMGCGTLSHVLYRLPLPNVKLTPSGWVNALTGKPVMLDDPQHGKCPKCGSNSVISDMPSSERCMKCGWHDD